jgi:DNA-binding IclR family transcriptional regulator
MYMNSSRATVFGRRNVKASVSPNGTGPIASVTRAFAILELLAFSESPMSLAEISKELRLAPSTTHRFLRALISSEFVRKDNRTSSYEATLKLFNLGSMVMAQFNLSERLLPIMRKIAEQTEDAVSLVLRESLEGILLERIEGRGVQVFAKYRRVPLYCTAAGKAILSCFDDKTLSKYLSRTRLTAKTQYTIVNAAELRREVEKIKREGVSIDNQEAVVGAKCIAVPLTLNAELMASLSVSALAPRMTDERLREIALLLKKAVAESGLLLTAFDAQKNRSATSIGGK